MRRIIGSMYWLVLLTLPVCAAEPPAQTLRPSDFAYGIPLATDGSHSVFSLSLPGDVYRQAVYADLRDVHVFNAAGEPVPFAIRPQRPAKAGAAVRTALPLSPIFVEPGRSTEDVHLYVHRSPSGTSISVHQRGRAPLAGSYPAFYIAATGNLKPAIGALELAWKRVGHSFIRGVRVEAGDDLRHWRMVSDDASIAEMVYDGHTEVHGRISLPGVRAKFLRIRLLGSGPGPRLTMIQAEAVPERKTPAPEWKNLLPVQGAKPGEFLFDTGGHLPVDRIQIEFPQESNLLRIALSSCEKKEGPCRWIGAGLIWRLHEGKRVLDRRELAVQRNNSRWILLRVFQSESSLGSTTPQLRVGWVPDSLVFIARGPAPYELAYGSARAKAAAYPIDTLLQSVDREGTVTPAPARAGTPHALGGPAVLVPKRELPWKQWTLWAVLILSVALLAWMATRLARQMR